MTNTNAKLIVCFAGFAATACPRYVVVIEQHSGLVECQITRNECFLQDVNESNPDSPTCTLSAATTFTATACAGPGPIDATATCAAAFCPDGSCVQAARTTEVGSLRGVCNPIASPTGKRSAFSCEVSGRSCRRDPQGNCTMLLPETNVLDGCFDPATETAQKICENSETFTSPHVRLTSVVQDDANCNAAASPLGLAYRMTPAPGLSTSFSGTTLNVGLTSGLAVVDRLCDVENCFNSELVSLRASFAPTTVLGQPLSNVTVRSARPVPLFSDTIPAGDLPLVLEGDVNGQRSLLAITNNAPVTLTATGQQFSLNGSLSIDLGTFFGPGVVTTNVAVSGTPSAVASACAGFSRIQNLFGFEDGSWHSSQALLSTVASPVTQGCAALNIVGSGYQPIVGAPFSTSELSAVGNTLRVDLFIPGNQPNPYWLGALQSYLTCPSVNLFNAYIGQVELTGKPTQAFSTLSFNLPQQIRSVLTQPASDCHIDFALNVNQTNQAWILDNLRLQ